GAEPTGDLLSVLEAAQVLRCKPRRVYDLRSAGRLPRTVEGGRAVVRRSDLDKLVADDDRLPFRSRAPSTVGSMRPARPPPFGTATAGDGSGRRPAGRWRKRSASARR